MGSRAREIPLEQAEAEAYEEERCRNDPFEIADRARVRREAVARLEDLAIAAELRRMAACLLGFREREKQFAAEAAVALSKLERWKKENARG